MSTDYKWMSQGGLLLDGKGDITLTSSAAETVISMVRTRLKSAVDGWKLYRIGAGLDDFPGDTSDRAEEVAIQRRVLASISAGYLPQSVFQVATIRLGNEIQVFVYLNKQLIAQATTLVNSTSTNTAG
jgi:hypothetical protein